jgi:hypothetical protein
MSFGHIQFAPIAGRSLTPRQQSVRIVPVILSKGGGVRRLPCVSSIGNRFRGAEFLSELTLDELSQL